MLAIADANSELSELVHTEKLGLYLQNDNLIALESILEKYSTDKEIRPKFRENVYNYYTKYGTAKYFQGRWLDVFKELGV